MKEIKESFFDNLGISGVEKIHSAMISWIFSKNCTCLTNLEKSLLLNKIFDLGDKLDYTFIKSYTEVNHMDVFIETDKSYFIIENKIKSSEHSKQTEEYRKSWEKENSNLPTKYLFLTLINETAVDSNWKNCTYSSLSDYLEDLLKTKKSQSESEIILKAYSQTIKNLKIVSEEFIDDFSSYPEVFKEGSKTKSQKASGNNKENKIMQYISDHQLETIFQKLFFRRLWSKNDFLMRYKEKNKIELTHKGNSLAGYFDSHGKMESGFFIKEIPNTDFTVSLSLHHSSIIIRIQKEGENYWDSKKEEIFDLEKSFKPFFKELKYSVGIGKSKAILSASKKIQPIYDYNSIRELQESLSNELDKCLNDIENYLKSQKSSLKPI